LRYAPGAYLDTRLLGIAQSLELFQGKRLNRPPFPPASPPPSILAILPPPAQEELRQWVKTLPTDTFNETLKEVIEEHQAILAPLSPPGIRSVTELVMAFRNYILHRSQRPSPSEVYSLGLFLVTETLSCLMKSCFLAELGFSQEERLALFQRNAMYSLIRDHWSHYWKFLEEWLAQQ